MSFHYACLRQSSPAMNFDKNPSIITPKAFLPFAIQHVTAKRSLAVLLAMRVVERRITD